MGDEHMNIELIGRLAIMLSIISGVILFIYVNLNYIPSKEENNGSDDTLSSDNSRK